MTATLALYVAFLTLSSQLLSEHQANYSVLYSARTGNTAVAPMLTTLPATCRCGFIRQWWLTNLDKQWRLMLMDETPAWWLWGLWLTFLYLLIWCSMCLYQYICSGIAFWMQYKRWFMLFLSSEPIYRSLLASTWKIHWDSRALDHQYITLSSQSSTNVRGGPFSSIEFGIIFVFAIRALKVHEC